MSIEALGFIAEQLEQLGINYEYYRWTKDITYPYFVGEYQETETINSEETGCQEATFILDGYTKGSWLPLEEAKKKIKEGITKTAILANGAGIAVSYSNTVIVPVYDEETKHIQITLEIQEWRAS